MCKAILRHWKWRLQTVQLLLPEYRILLKEFGAFNTKANQNKQKFLIIKEIHVIEKGLSLKDCRPGYGVPKVLAILEKLECYSRLYDDQELLVFTLSIIKRYIEFNKSANALDEQIENRYLALEAKVESWERYGSLCGGETVLTKQEVEHAVKIPYFNFVKARHSIRSFTGQPVSKELLLEALEIASYTPSACNRQPWGAHVFTNIEKIIQILDLQTGARQFKDMVGALIIVTSTCNAFFGGENNQWYVNGGMYSMSLMYAIHSLGLGCIPLNLGIPQERLEKIWRIGNIDSSEVPIVLLAIGHLPDSFKVAHSCRFPITDYVKFDQ